ncbi:MAG: EAL domain-containing response regulator, partial [Gammaproteobacteria bacterium]|nr:EAL domain-containing response regulator [Gammaproteobacteria bacterium]
MTKKLLVVEDERDVGALIAKAGRLAGYSVQLASRPQTFKTLLESFHPDVVIMDLQIPGEDGIELLGHLSGVNKPISVIINSGMDQSVIESARAVADSYKLNVIGTLQKPFSIKELVGLLNISSAAQAEITRDGLITALQEDQFEIHYQPKIFLHNVKGPAAGEALLRWRHPELGMVSPAVFIEMFEQADLMRPLTELVVNKIAKQMHAWEKAGIMPDIAINISPDTLKETDFPDALHKIIAMEGIDPRRVTLEITESMNIVHQSHCIEVLSRLRIKGFGVSLDDFGIGYSSLQRLYQLPVNEIK